LFLLYCILIATPIICLQKNKERRNIHMKSADLPNHHSISMSRVATKARYRFALQCDLSVAYSHSWYHPSPPLSEGNQPVPSQPLNYCPATFYFLLFCCIIKICTILMKMFKKSNSNEILSLTASLLIMPLSAILACARIFCTS